MKTSAGGNGQYIREFPCAAGVFHSDHKKESDEVKEAVKLYKKKIPPDEAVLMNGIGKTTFYKFMKADRT